MVLTSHVGGKKIHQPEERVKVKNPILPRRPLWKTFTLDFLLAAILFVVLLEPNYLSLLSIK